MDRSSILCGKYFGLILAYLFIFNTPVSYAQSVSWVRSYGNSTIQAREKNKLILADFWAIWCVPCLKMDKEAWIDDTISSITKNFVCMQFDVSNGWQNADPYFVDVIPTIKILDYRGEVLFTKESYADKDELKEILSSFPADVSELYQALKKTDNDKKNSNYLLDLAAAYQNCALRSGPYASDIFTDESDKIFKKAKSAFKREKDYPNIDRINLLMALNYIISGKFEKGTDSVFEELDQIGDENLTLAYYVLVKGCLKQDKEDLADQYYNKLKSTAGGEEYLPLLQPEFE